MAESFRKRGCFCVNSLSLFYEHLNPNATLLLLPAPGLTAHHSELTIKSVESTPDRSRSSMFVEPITRIQTRHDFTSTYVEDTQGCND